MNKMDAWEDECIGMERRKYLLLVWVKRRSTWDTEGNKCVEETRWIDEFLETLSREDRCRVERVGVDRYLLFILGC